MSHPASTPGHNPVAAFYPGLLARGAAWGLRVSHTLAPGWATRLALRLFFTPFPLKLAARRRAVPDGWRVEHWPFEAGAMAVYRRTEAGGAERPTVLLVHGWAGHAQQMLPLAEAAAQAGLNPVLLDFPGHGRSQGWRATLPQFTRALWAASARLGPLHAVVAHSLGAVATAHAAANGLPVARLALLAPSPPPSLFLQWFGASLGLGEALPQRMGALIERVEGVPLRQFDPAWLGPRLARPTLVVRDDSDRVSPPPVGQRLAQAISAARLLTTHGLGHRRLLADADVLRAVADHLLDTGRPNPS